MFALPLAHPRPAAGVPGLLLAVLALVSLLALGAMPLHDEPAQRQQSALEAISVMCGTAALPDHGAPPHGAPHGTHHGRPRHRPLPACAPLPLAVALALPAFLPVLPALLPGPSAGARQRPALRPTARAPPARRSRPGFPRGPPVLF